MDERNIKYCGGCQDFLYEDASGYGICMHDNDFHSCAEPCLYGYKKTNSNKLSDKVITQNHTIYDKE